MARISVWFVRTALLYFALGATAGAWRLAASGGISLAAPAVLRTAHVEVMLLGWVCQLAIGVAVWILPFADWVSSDRRLWGAWAALNGGILLVALGQWGDWGLGRALGRAAEVGAGGLVLWVLWPRIRALPTRRDE